jgi:hypothetical protein
MGQMLDAGYWILDKSMPTPSAREARIQHPASRIPYRLEPPGDIAELMAVRRRLTDSDICP